MGSAQSSPHINPPDLREEDNDFVTIHCKDYFSTLEEQYYFVVQRPHYPV